MKRLGYLLFAVMAITLMLGGNAFASAPVNQGDNSSYFRHLLFQCEHHWCARLNRPYHQRWRLCDYGPRGRGKRNPVGGDLRVR